MSVSVSASLNAGLTHPEAFGSLSVRYRFLGRRRQKQPVLVNDHRRTRGICSLAVDVYVSGASSSSGAGQREVDAAGDELRPPDDDDDDDLACWATAMNRRTDSAVVGSVFTVVAGAR